MLGKQTYTNTWTPIYSLIKADFSLWIMTHTNCENRKAILCAHLFILTFWFCKRWWVKLCLIDCASFPACVCAFIPVLYATLEEIWVHYSERLAIIFRANFVSPYWLVSCRVEVVRLCMWLKFLCLEHFILFLTFWAALYSVVRIFHSSLHKNILQHSSIRKKRKKCAFEGYTPKKPDSSTWDVHVLIKKKKKR